MSSTTTHHTNTPSSSAPKSHDQSPSSYLTYPVSHVVSGLYRRLTDPSASTSSSRSQSRTSQSSQTNTSTHMSGIYTPTQRTASPFQPPPLTPLTLRGICASTSPSAQILSRSLAEEIRLLVPPRLQLVDDWALVYSVEQDGVSLATLYNKCDEYRGKRAGYVLVVRDGVGGIFGAYLSSPPRPSPHYYGTGECFLWRASILPPPPSTSVSASASSSFLSSLPLPPSTDTTHLQRSTTLASPKTPSASSFAPSESQPNLLHLLTSHPTNSSSHSGASTPPDLIRFKAFPYSGVNDYVIFCEQGYLSIGGGDGKYGLWLDGVLERGVSSASMTFGNEGLSEEGEKFEVVGVEVWGIGV